MQLPMFRENLLPPSSTLKMEAAGSLNPLVPPASLNGVIAQKTTI
jgi:hypothetical protein